MVTIPRHGWYVTVPPSVMSLPELDRCLAQRGETETLLWVEGIGDGHLLTPVDVCSDDVGWKKMLSI